MNIIFHGRKKRRGGYIENDNGGSKDFPEKELQAVTTCNEYEIRLGSERTNRI